MKFSNFKHTLLFVTVLLLISCNNTHENAIKHLEGYWEIESVILNDGTTKDYNYNNTIDHIALTDSLTGIRKKLKPMFDGTYETSTDAEFFTIKIENDSLNLYYKTPFATWKETVLLATSKQLKIVNQSEVVFLYKRYQPMAVITE